MPWQGRRRFSIAHPSVPSRLEGKKYRLSNDLFPSRRECMAKGRAIQFRPLPLFQHRYRYILGVTRPRPHDRWFYWVGFVCVSGQRERDANLPRHAGMDCRHPEHRDVTPPSPSLALDANPRSATRPTITESAVGSLGGVRAGEARALRARDGRTAESARLLTETAPQRLQALRAATAAVSVRRPASRAVALGTRPARRHSPLPRPSRPRDRSTR